jgi:O-antigen/teichoic acid export membrane protein
MLGELVTRALPFALIPYLSRKLGVDGYGELSLYQAWISLVIILISYAQEAAIIRYVYFYGRRSLGILLGAGYFYSAFMTTLLCTISFIYNSEFMLIVVLCSFTQTLVKIELTVRQALNEPKRYVLIQMLSSILSVLFTVIILEYTTLSASGRMIALILSYGIVAGFFIFLSHRKSFTYSYRQYRLGFLYLIAFCTPLLANNLSSFFKGQFDRVFIEDQFTLSQLGEYAVGYQLSSIIFIISFVVYRAVEPVYFSKLKSGLKLKSINKKVMMYGVVGFVPYIISLYIPEKLYEFMLGEGFSNIGTYTQPFVLAFSINAIYFVYSSYLSYLGRTKVIALISVSSMFLYLFLLFVFAEFGLWAIPYATVFSNIFLLFLAVISSKKVTLN